MKMRSKGGVMVLAVLMVDFSGQFSALHACAHGASGKEQVGYREGNDRIEAVIVGDFASKKIVKLFVGPPSEKVFGSIKDYESVKKKLKPLADRAAWLAEQGESSMSLRGGPGSVDLGGGVAALPRSFVGDQLDWDKIKSELALPDSPNDDEFRKWVGKIKRYDRGLHALIIDSKNLAGKETTSLAAKIKYEGGSSASNMLLDKYLAQLPQQSPFPVYF